MGKEETKTQENGGGQSTVNHWRKKEREGESGFHHLKMLRPTESRTGRLVRRCMKATKKFMNPPFQVTPRYPLLWK